MAMHRSQDGLNTATQMPREDRSLDAGTSQFQIPLAGSLRLVQFTQFRIQERYYGPQTGLQEYLQERLPECN